MNPFEESKKYFGTQLQEFQFFDKYSRFNEEKGRRETWTETVDRTVDYLIELSEDKLSTLEYAAIRYAILNMEVMPSMRLLAMAGPAARRDQISIFNCAYRAIDSLSAFTDILRLFMNGVGVGFSVEKRHVDKLPEVQKGTGTAMHLIVADSTDGWVEALILGLEHWFSGSDISFDFSLIRPEGAILHTKGGVSSGPEPLKELLREAKKIILGAQGRKLRPIEVYDIVCLIASCVISGGVRRTAALCLFDHDDKEMLDSKLPENIEGKEHRYYTNNSAVMPERHLSQVEILNYITELHRGGNGEPGFFSRLAIKNTIPERRQQADFGVNACAESILRNKGLCNLSSVICRADDEWEDLKRKVRIATMIGTIQSMAVDFSGFDEEWSNNAKEERLLGVDLNAQMDCKLVRVPKIQSMLKEMAIKWNKRYAEILGIPESKAITLVKPSGNSGVLLDVSSGLHPRWSEYYIRNVRVNRESPLCYALRESGVHLSPENGQTEENATSYVISFPMKSPEGAITRNQMSALDQCNYWYDVKMNWCEHNPSITVYYGEDEIIDLAQWIYRHQEIISGMAFLPRMDIMYEQAPYIEISKEQYESMVEEFPTIDFSLIAVEQNDTTTGAQEIACSAGACELRL